jgi:hypothetical protein
MLSMGKSTICSGPCALALHPKLAERSLCEIGLSFEFVVAMRKGAIASIATATFQEKRAQTCPLELKSRLRAIAIRHLECALFLR